jgi:DeoR/GlpR family transcriptional regulator of sugar metabolism
MFRAIQPNDNFVTTAPANEERICEEKHYSVNELSALWNLSKQTIRRLFQDEPDVVRIGEKDVCRKRAYVTLRIPESVVRRVHQRMSKSA